MSALGVRAQKLHQLRRRGLHGDVGRCRAALSRPSSSITDQQHGERPRTSPLRPIWTHMPSRREQSPLGPRCAAPSPHAPRDRLADQSARDRRRSGLQTLFARNAQSGVNLAS